MGVLLHLHNAYHADSKATLRVKGEPETFKVVSQGCILFPVLFNTNTKNTMRKSLDEWSLRIRVDSLKISNVRFAGGTTC
jgi:hypothetical protein